MALDTCPNPRLVLTRGPHFLVLDSRPFAIPPLQPRSRRVCAGCHTTSTLRDVSLKIAFYVGLTLGILGAVGTFPTFYQMFTV